MTSGCLELGACRLILLHCLKILHLNDDRILYNTLEILYGILLKIRDTLNANERNDKECIDILSMLAGEKFNSKIQNLVHFSTDYDVRSTAVRICLPMVEFVRIRPTKPCCVDLAKQVVDSISSSMVSLLSQMIVFPKNSDRIFSITFIYALFTIHEWRGA